MSTIELSGDTQFVELLTHAKGRDLISLFAYINSLNQGQAAQQIADKLGMPARHGATWRISGRHPSGDHTKKEVSSYE